MHEHVPEHEELGVLPAGRDPLVEAEAEEAVATQQVSKGETVGEPLLAHVGNLLDVERLHLLGEVVVGVEGENDAGGGVEDEADQLRQPVLQPGEQGLLGQGLGVSLM